jgi:hypothetical protein
MNNHSTPLILRVHVPGAQPYDIGASRVREFDRVHRPRVSTLPAVHGQRFQRRDLVRGPAQYDLI